MLREEMEFDGSDNVSPYSERATPPYFVWARDLQYILDDYDGYQLFASFLKQSNSENELFFWYACKGLRSYDSTINRELVLKVAKDIFNKNILPNGGKFLQCVSPETRMQLRTRFQASNVNDIDEHVFDTAQQEVEESLRKRHEEFVQSDTYVLYLQAQQAYEADGLDSATCYENDLSNSLSDSSSNSGDVHRPSSSMLPTLHEDVEFESNAVDKNFSGRYSEAETIRIDETTSDCQLSIIGDETTTNQTAAAAIASSSATRDDRKRSKQIGGESSTDTVLRDLTQSTGERRKTATPSTSTSEQKLTRSTLVKTLGQRMRSAIPATEPGMPPNPYHTKKTYVPHINTSAQDSELQSMSSDAATESSVSGANFRHHERTAYKLAKQNVEKENFIPRTQRHESEHQTMLNAEFRRDLIIKLEKLREANSKHEKLRESLKNLSEPENQANSHRTVVQEFSKVEKAAPDNAESILDEHCTSIGWQDTPPVRSPGFASTGRRRSPGSKSPDRRIFNNRMMMTTSYPQTMASNNFQYNPQYQVFPGRPTTTTTNMPNDHNNIHWTQSAILPPNFTGSPRHRTSGAPSHSASNTLHRHRPVDNQPPLLEFAQQFDKQRSMSTRPKFPVQQSVHLSASSGFSSSNSTQVSLDHDVNGPNISSGARPKVRSTGTVPICVNPVTKQHKTSTKPKTSSNNVEKIRGQKTNVNSDLNVQMRKLNLGANGSARPIVDPTMSGTSSSTMMNYNNQPTTIPVGSNSITVVYMLPNELTPFRTKFLGKSMTLKQFKSLLAKPKRQGSFKFYFKCMSDDGGDIWEEVENDNEVVPFHGFFKVEARVDAAD